MGIRIIQLIAADERFALAAAIDRAGHPKIGEDAGVAAGVDRLGVSISTELGSQPVDVMIDFSLPPGALRIADVCAARGIPLVVGTTGFEPADKARIEAHANRIAVLISPNMSKAVNLLMRLVRQAAHALGPDDCEVAIVERHHRTKKDAPSGTALKLADQVGRPVDVHALRQGDCPGEHTVIFGLMGETLELSHRAANRDGFARGALDAARFLAGKSAGLYSVDDWLGSRS